MLAKQERCLSSPRQESRQLVAAGLSSATSPFEAQQKVAAREEGVCDFVCGRWNRPSIWNFFGAGVYACSVGVRKASTE
eukprot:5518191-Amphidinium_carterae.1